MQNNTNTRRKFLKTLGSVGAGISAASAIGHAAKDNQPSRIAGAQYMGDFAAPKLNQIRIAIIGCGARGTGHYTHLSAIENTEIVGLCDINKNFANRAKARCEKNGKGKRHQNITLYTENEHSYKKMLTELKPDLVYVVTPWKWHAPMAIDAMNAGAHVGVEVPMALTIKEHWDIVNTSEKTRKHCMQLENVNYGRDELMFLNMCRQNLFGDLLHGEASYIHELRGQMHGSTTGSWRTFHYAERNGNLYPTHGLGPVAQYMNLARGDDNFRRIVSFSSPALGRAAYAKEKFPADHKWNQLDYQGGDISTSIIKTTLGRTIMVQWDETSPRPYSRHNLIQGTKGTGAGFPTRIALDGGVPGGPGNHHGWAQGNGLKEMYAKYDHPLWKRMKDSAAQMGGHGGMDWIMNYRVIECLRNGQPLDQNVYEGAFWSVVAPLSEASVAADGMPQDFPDFTRGEWKNTKPLGIIN